MSGRHRAPRPGPAKGSRLTLVEHFFWTLIVAGFVMVGTVVLAFVVQDQDPANIRTECEPRWGCHGPDQSSDTSAPRGATP